MFHIYTHYICKQYSALKSAELHQHNSEKPIQPHYTQPKRNQPHSLDRNSASPTQCGDLGEIVYGGPLHC